MVTLQTEDWPAALKMVQEGSVEDFEVSFVNRGGVRGVLAGIEGFMPFSKMCTGLSGINAAQQYKSLMSTLPGLKLRVKVVSVSFYPQSYNPCCLCHTDALIWHMQMHVWFLHCTKGHESVPM